MKCPKCGSDELKVNESRDLEEGSAIRRRRECLSCANRFTTYERVEAPRIIVKKQDGKFESYSREKILSGVKKALVNRPFSDADIKIIIDDIEKVIIENYNKEIESGQVGKIVMKRLKEVDQVAYLRFVSVYKRFDQSSQFTKELEALKK